MAAVTMWLTGATLILSMHAGLSTDQLSHPGPTPQVTCHQEEDAGHVTPTSGVLSELFSQLCPSAIIVITDGQTDVDIRLRTVPELLTKTVVSDYQVSDQLMAENITKILKAHNKLTSLTNRQYLLVACSMNCIVELLRQAQVLDMTGPTQGVFVYMARWVVLVPPTQLNTLEEHVGNVTHLTVVVDVANSFLSPHQAFTTTTHRIYSASWQVSGRHFVDIGRYSCGRLRMTSQLFPNTLYGFNNRTFTVTVNVWGPFLSRYKSGNATFYDGMCIAMLETVSRYLNFSYILVEPEDGNWGTLANGSWTGIVAQLEAKSVDFSVAPLAVSTGRESVMDFAFPFYLEYTAVLYSSPKQEAHVISFFLQPFHWVVWALLLAAILFTAGVLTAIATLSPQERRHPLQGNYYNSLWFTLGAFFNQGSIHVPTSMTSRAVFGFFWAFCLVMVATYSGNLVASLTVTRIQAPFSTVEELAAQTDYTIGTMGGTIWEEMLQTSTMAVYQRIWQRIYAEHTDPSRPFDVLDQLTENHIEQAKRGQYAVISDITTFELAMSRSCDITMMAEKFFAMRYAMSFQNNSVYTNIFSDTVVRLHETGLLDIWRQRFWPHIDRCTAPTQMARSISVPDLLGVIFTAIGLLALGALLLTTEVLIHQLTSKCTASR